MLQAHGWSVIAVESEQHSGADYAGRVGLQRALGRIEDGSANVLLAYATDRLSREQMHVGVILDRVLRAGGSLQFVSEDFENSATGKLLLQVRTFAAELEREKIAERFARGKAARTASGKYLPGQKAPYGFRWTPDTDRHGKLIKARLFEDPETAPVVRRIFREIADAGSARQMAAILNRECVPTPTRRGAYWYSKTISDIIWHPVYVGQAVAWRRRMDGKRSVLRDPSEMTPLPDAAPALVSAELASAAQARLTRNRQEPPQQQEPRRCPVEGRICALRLLWPPVVDGAAQRRHEAAVLPLQPTQSRPLRVPLIRRSLHDARHGGMEPRGSWSCATHR